jgi:hypothetical protein
MKASDFMKKLEKDPKCQPMQERRDRELAERQKFLSEDEYVLVEELVKLGYEVNSVWDFTNNNNRHEFLRQFDGDYSEAYPTLVKHLKITHHPRIREGIIRALTEKSANSVAAEALLTAFYEEHDPNLKWVLANALRTVLTQTQKRKHPEYKEVYNGKGLP